MSRMTFAMLHLQNNNLEPHPKQQINQGKRIGMTCAKIHLHDNHPEPHAKVNTTWCLVTHRASFPILFFFVLFLTPLIWTRGDLHIGKGVHSFCYLLLVISLWWSMVFVIFWFIMCKCKLYCMCYKCLTT